MLAAASVLGCTQPQSSILTQTAAAPTVEPTPEPEPVTLTVAGAWPDCRALDAVAAAFTAAYPNCTVRYEYLQDYYASLEKRLNGSEPVDLFFTTNIQADSALLPYALELYGAEGLNLADTFDGLIQNFALRGGAEDKAALYSLPLGAEMRGLYVNTTLLDSLNIDMPTDQASLLAACETLKENGYIPLHGNPGTFAQTLLYPWVSNLIANAPDPKAAYDRVSARAPGLSEMFRAPFEFLYTLVENGYYDYKRAQTELNLFTDSTDDDYARYFFHVEKRNGEFVKASDLGQVAFMPGTLSLLSTVEKCREDYHSKIEFKFLPAPVGPEGGYAYLSPAHGIAAYKDSLNAEWAVKFLDFLFRPENNKLFAKAFNVIPNTKEAFDYIRSLYDIPDGRISHLGQVTFDYGFYDLITKRLVELSKANNPKYMQTDAAGNVSLYPLTYYLDLLEESFQQK